MRHARWTLCLALACATHPSSGGSSGGTYGTSGGGSTGGASIPCPQCTGQGLVCGLDGGCESCESDQSCVAAGGANHACDLDVLDSGTHGLCVQCTAEVSCPAGQVCDVLGSEDSIAVPGPAPSNLCQPDCRNDAGLCQPGLSACDPATGLCLSGCVSTANNCAAASLLCDVDAGLCVQCFSPSDCPITNAGCVGQDCGGCGSSTDCPLGQTCDVPHAICYCASNTQCTTPAPDCIGPTGFKNPDAGTAELVCGCVPDGGSCAKGTVCSPTSGHPGAGACLPSCIDGGVLCAQGQYCNLVTQLCGPCRSDVNCYGSTAGYICATDGGLGGQCTCALGAASTCPKGLVCNPPLGCTPSCLQSDAGCTSGVCDPNSGACRGCLTNAECAANPAGTACDNSPDGGSFTCFCQSYADCLDADVGCSSILRQCGLCAVATDCPPSSPGCNSASDNCGSCVVDGDCPAVAPHCSDAGICG